MDQLVDTQTVNQTGESGHFLILILHRVGHNWRRLSECLQLFEQITTLTKTCTEKLASLNLIFNFSVL